MFHWLKGRVAKVSNSAAAEALRAEFSLLHELPNAPRRLADRLVNYVLKGDKCVLANLASLKNTHLAVPLVSLHHRHFNRQKGLAELLKHLPHDPEFLLRLAKVYDAVQTAGAGVTYIYRAPTIPAFRGSLSWLGTFLIELSGAGNALKHHAGKGTADERYYAVRSLARSGDDAAREFLTQRLDSEKSEKVCAAIREAVAEAAITPDETPDDDYKFPEIPEVPIVAPLDKNYLLELRELITNVENATAAEFSRNQRAQQYQWTRTPVPPEAADRSLILL